MCRVFTVSILLKKTVNMFECMDIAESINESVVEPSYKKSTRADSTRNGHSRKNRGEAASSHTYSTMSDSSGERRKICLDYPKGE